LGIQAQVIQAWATLLNDLSQFIHFVFYCRLKQNYFPAVVWFFQWSYRFVTSYEGVTF
jgi:hypothetical protein